MGGLQDIEMKHIVAPFKDSYFMQVIHPIDDVQQHFFLFYFICCLIVCLFDWSLIYCYPLYEITVYKNVELFKLLWFILYHKECIVLCKNCRIFWNFHLKSHQLRFFSDFNLLPLKILRYRKRDYDILNNKLGFICFY